MDILIWVKILMYNFFRLLVEYSSHGYSVEGVLSCLLWEITIILEKLPTGNFTKHLSRKLFFRFCNLSVIKHQIETSNWRVSKAGVKKITAIKHSDSLRYFKLSHSFMLVHKRTEERKVQSTHMPISKEMFAIQEIFSWNSDGRAWWQTN